MIINVLFIIMSILFSIILIMVFSPVILFANFAVSDTGRNAKVHLLWLHPKLLRLTYDMTGKRLAVRILGWHLHLAEEKAHRKRKTDTETAKRFVEPVSRGKHPAETLERQETNVRENGSLRLTGGLEHPKPEKMLNRRSITWRKVKSIIVILNRQKVTGKILRCCGWTLQACFKLIRFDHCFLHAKAGAEDPAETGKIYGYYIALNHVFFGGRKKNDVRVEPYFTGAMFEFQGNIRLRTSIARISIPVMVALMTFPYFTVLIVWWRLKKLFNSSAVTYQ
ncbi:MAG: DUF2953 domain-containing protein [Chitinispirillaceae bacterium]